ncbi:MAG TPA: MBL fold metallo-hydrolase [Chloroflexota bacterium]|nr:MBL fold metallo-hydrolase [Chloroflexota bacterium]
MSSDSARITFVGHSTLLIDMDGTRVLTDPLLRDRLAHLYRHAPPPAPEVVTSLDAVLTSHLHLDHLDLFSLRRLGTDCRLIVPDGAGPFLRRRGFTRVEEVRPGDSLTAGSLQIRVTPAEHSGFRPPIGPTGVALGFVIAGRHRVYFAGDTDLFPQMADLAGKVDVALLPVWGWGRALGPGHLDPKRAAEALTRLKPSLAIPIHWGTFAARGVRKRDPAFLVDPPLQFARYAALLAPEVTVKILQPGDSTPILADTPSP